MDFMIHGQRVRESTGMSSITRAQKVYDNRRRELEDGTAGIRKRKQLGLFSVAAEEWRELRKGSWSPNTQSIVDYAFEHLIPLFGKKLVVDIEAIDIARYQKARLAEGASNRTINIETASALRPVLKKAGVWERIKSDYHPLSERQDVGHALTSAEEAMLMLECGRSRSRSLAPFVTLLIETGSRYGTVRTLTWGNVDFANRCLKFGKDKTAAGTGRSVPLSYRAFEALKFWAQHFPDRQPSHYVFPFEQYGGAGRDEAFGFTGSKCLNTDPTRPIGSIKTAWVAAKGRTRRHCPNCLTGTLVDARKPAAGYLCIDCNFETEELPAGLTKLRLHDTRHTFCSRAIRARVPLPMLAKIVGWSPSTLAKMAARYGHFGLEELRDAMESMGRPAAEIQPTSEGSPQFPPQASQKPTGQVN
ncbi:MAG TPA: integrase [Acidobacteriaceae bacterium]|jgi:integrase|nr:integrase [Acidobacteriaceae bacterium]